MSLIAVSFCNQPPNQGPLLVVIDTETKERRVPALPRGDFLSACGLAIDDSHLYCAIARTDADQCCVAIFDRLGEQFVHMMELPGVSDVHSIVLDSDSIVAVSTGTDEIFRFDRSTGKGEIVWRAGSSGRDTHHINSIAQHDGRLLCSAFGQRFGEKWADAVDGYIYDVGSATYLARGLYHPHSIALFNGSLFLCESGESALRSLDGAIRYTNGYTRGLAFRADGTYFLGSSIGRRTPQIPGAILNAFDPGEPAGSCAVEMGNLAGQSVIQRFNVGDLAREIYDIALIE